MKIPTQLPNRFAPDDELLVKLVAAGVVGEDDSYAQWLFGPSGVILSGKATMPSFSRVSAATRYEFTQPIENVSAHVMRADHDPVTGNFRGALFEGATTNLLNWPASFGNSVWVPLNQAGVTVTNAISVIPGFMATKYVNGSGTAAQGISQVLSAGVAGNYSVSLIIESVENVVRTGFGLRRVSAASWIAEVSFIWATATIQHHSATPSGSHVERLGVGPNGGLLYRISFRVSSEILETDRLYFYPSGSGGGNENTGCIIHHAQFEPGGVSSPVLSSAGQMSRSADVTVVNDMPLFDREGGIFLMKISSYPGSGALANRFAFALGTFPNAIRIETSSTGVPRASVGDGSSQSISTSLTSAALSEGVWEYLAVSYSTTNGCYYGRRIGSADPLVSATSFSSYSGANQVNLRIAENFNGHFGDFGIRYMPGQYNATDIANLLAEIP